MDISPMVLEKFTDKFNAIERKNHKLKKNLTKGKKIRLDDFCLPLIQKNSGDFDLI